VSLRPPDSPIIVGHPQLSVERPLSTDDLEGFGVLVATDANGPLITSTRGSEAEYAQALLASLDPRLDRVTYQQYVKLAVVRRDASFEMCGTSGVLVLSGADLLGSFTLQMVTKTSRPWRQRRVAWPPPNARRRPSLDPPMPSSASLLHR
jgi:hypothetical protein